MGTHCASSLPSSVVKWPQRNTLRTRECIDAHSHVFAQYIKIKLSLIEPPENNKQTRHHSELKKKREIKWNKMNDDDDVLGFCFKITLAERSQAHILKLIVTLGSYALHLAEAFYILSFALRLSSLLLLKVVFAAVTSQAHTEQIAGCLERTKYNTSNRAPNLLASSWSRIF